MTADERVREDLATLAATEQGRRLLQLGLRGIANGELGVTAGCWVAHGSAGCLFQHAYWQGVREGVFADVEKLLVEALGDAQGEVSTHRDQVAISV